MNANVLFAENQTPSFLMQKGGEKRGDGFGSRQTQSPSLLIGLWATLRWLRSSTIRISGDWVSPEPADIPTPQYFVVATPRIFIRHSRVDTSGALGYLQAPDEAGSRLRAEATPGLSLHLVTKEEMSLLLFEKKEEGSL